MRIADGRGRDLDGGAVEVDRLTQDLARRARHRDRRLSNETRPMSTVTDSPPSCTRQVTIPPGVCTGNGAVPTRPPSHR